MMSAAVATPGKIGDARVARPPSASGSVSPGETMNCAPGIDRLVELRLVEHRPGADDRALRPWLICRMASSAPGVRSVTSSTGRPAPTNVSASAAQSCSPSSTSTGMTGAAAHDLVDGHPCSFAKAAAAPIQARLRDG